MIADNANPKIQKALLHTVIVLAIGDDASGGILKASRAAKAFEATAVHDPTTERAADNPLRKQSRVYQGVKIDACVDTHLMSHEHHILGADVSRRSPVGVTGKRTASEPRN